MSDSDSRGSSVSIVLPAKNEAQALRDLLPQLREAVPDAEIIVVDDGSTDETPRVLESLPVRVVRHSYSKGNGAAVKSGLRAATGDLVVCMDGDGQHAPADVPRLVSALDQDIDMAVGARSPDSQATLWRRVANSIYNRFAGWVVGHRIPDLTSGMRAMRRERALQFLHLLPNGFSYPTTMTMAFFRAGYGVSYVPIEARQREGKSHISPFKDGIRFLLIIFKVGTLYSPLKIFFPASFLFFALGAAYYAFTFFTQGRFTNMGALLLLTSVIVFLVGLVSEQVTALMYQPAQRR